MFKDQIQLISRLTKYADIFLIIMAFLSAYIFAGEVLGRSYENILNYMWVLLFAIPVWTFLIKKYHLNPHFKKFTDFDILTRLINVHFFGGIIVASVILFLDRDHYSRLLFISFVLFSFVFLLMWKVLVKKKSQVFSRSDNKLRNILIVGVNDKAFNFSRMIEENEEWGYRIQGFLDVPGQAKKDRGLEGRVIGNLMNILEVCKSHPVDEVIFCLPQKNSCNVDDCFRALEGLGITVRMVLDFYDYDSRRAKRELDFFADNLPVLTFHTKTLDAQQLFAKRLLDVVGAFFGLAVTAVIFPFVYFGIKVESPGLVFFSQERAGENGRTFKCWKFRSMYMDAEERKQELAKNNEMNGAIFKIKDDPRITRVGRFLRKTSLDELPQFWNVLKGDMSLVGTRPPTLDEVGQYENWHRRRISIKPGITGLWQVNGRNKITDFDQIVRLDLQYIDNWDFWLDIKILLKTVRVVLARKGCW